jgi:hypothetical protein
MSARTADSVKGTMKYLLVILVGLLGYGVAASVAISMTPGAGERGCENTWTEAR